MKPSVLAGPCQLPPHAVGSLALWSLCSWNGSSPTMGITAGKPPAASAVWCGAEGRHGKPPKDLFQAVPPNGCFPALPKVALHSHSHTSASSLA